MGEKICRQNFTNRKIDTSALSVLPVDSYHSLHCTNAYSSDVPVKICIYAVLLGTVHKLRRKEVMGGGGGGLDRKFHFF